MTFSLKRITFGSIEDSLPDAATTTLEIYSVTFQQRFWQPKRIRIYTPTAFSEIPFQLKNPWSEKDFLRRVEEYLESRHQHLSEIQRFGLVYLCRYQLTGTLYQEKNPS